MKTVGQTIARTLAQAGVRFVFGHPGGEVAHLMESLRQEGVEFILTHHEATAAYLAASWGEITGQPGVCLSTLGPGASNLLSGVAHGFLDRCPMIAITAQLATDREIRATHQRLDLHRLFSPVTKASIRVAPDTAAMAVEHALYLSTAERPGPVHLEIPSNVAGQEFTGVERGPRLAGPGDSTAPVTVTANRIISSSARPLILAGIGVTRGNASSALLRIAIALNAPVITTPKAKGVIPEDHPLAAGVIDMTGEGVVSDLIRQADLLITAGFDVVELIKPWNYSAHIIHVDTVPNVDQLYPAEVEIVGNIGASLDRLASSVEKRSAWSAEELTNHRRRLRAALRPTCEGLAPHTVMEVVRSVYPRNAVVASDVGAHKILLGQLWTTFEPRTYFVSNGLSSMGTGIPSAMAAKLAMPERPVVAIIGDGGLSMYLGELETAVRLGLDLTIVVLVDGSLSLIKLGQAQRGYRAFGVDFNRIRIAEIAEAMGARGVRVETEEQVRDAVESARTRDGVTVVEAIVDAAAYTGGE